MDSKDSIVKQAARKLDEYLESKNLKKTPERYEVLKAVCRIKGLFSVEELAAEMAARADFKVSRGTLFNTIELLTEAQLVVKHAIVRTAKYESNLNGRPKVCLICQMCGSVTKYEDKDMSEWLKRLQVRQFATRQQVLYLYGVCRKCSARSRTARCRAKKNTTKP